MYSNAGPAIGVGEQRVWLADDREAFCRAVLRKRPKNYDCLKGLAIALQSKLNMKDSISDNESKNNTRFEITNLLRYLLIS